jgi:hypothetical protein
MLMTPIVNPKNKQALSPLGRLADMQANLPASIVSFHADCRCSQKYAGKKKCLRAVR